LLFFASANFIPALRDYPNLQLDPLWPLFWTRWTGQEWGIRLALTAFLFGSLAAAFKPDWRWNRVLAFLGCLLGMALDNSFGKINNHLHLWTFAAFLLIFLPREKEAAQSVEGREAALRIFWGTQAFILLTYSMSGVAKLLGALVQMARGDAYWLFSPEALSRQVAERLLMTQEKSLLGAWIIAHPFWGWPALLAAVYLEVFSLAAAFRPSWHRPWALALVGMHVGIFLAMNVGFPHSILLLSLFFFASPFAGHSFPFKQRLRDLPWLGPFLITGWDALQTRNRNQDTETVVYYDGECGICNRWVVFLLSRPLPAEWKFASLQGNHYQALKARYPILDAVDTLLIYRREGEAEYLRGRAEGVFWLLPQLPGWTRWALIANLSPPFISNSGYRVVAWMRHRLGKMPACPVYPESVRFRFLD
jgi:predicted DCC family thiol-disulfide oxidoreductase YuxK